MKRIPALAEWLSEAKQRGSLYHFTTIRSLVMMAAEGRMGTLGKHEEVSLTRDKNLWRSTKIVPHEVRVELDGDALSERYRIRPYQWNAEHFYGRKASDRGRIEDQAEEVVVGEISPLRRYVKSVVIDSLELDSILGEDEDMRDIGAAMGKDPDDISPGDIVEFVRAKGLRAEVGRF